MTEKTFLLNDGGSNVVDSLDSLDLKAVIKAAQTICGEIERKEMLNKLMEIIIGNSGSNQGHILIRGENSWILAVSGALNETIEIIVEDQEIDFENELTKKILPFSVISDVIRSKDPLIIGNIPESQFSLDSYFLESKALSVMCAPIFLQNVLLGIVYLENHVATEAFIKERLEVIKVLASFVVISLENSILYSKLEKHEIKRIKQLERTKQLNEALGELERQNKMLKATDNNLIPLEKLTGMSQLSANVANDINNSLGFVSGNFDTLKKYILRYEKVIEEIDVQRTKAELLEQLGTDKWEFNLDNIWKENKLDWTRKDMPEILGDIWEGIQRIAAIVNKLKNISRINEVNNSNK